MPKSVNALLKHYTDDLRRLYGKHLKAVILYGSYARGDFGPDSDIEIMVLVVLSDEEIKDKGHSLSDLTFDYNYENGLEIMPIAKNVDHFNRWLRAYPFYYNVESEGVKLYAG